MFRSSSPSHSPCASGATVPASPLYLIPGSPGPGFASILPLCQNGESLFLTPGPDPGGESPFIACGGLPRAVVCHLGRSSGLPRTQPQFCSSLTLREGRGCPRVEKPLFCSLQGCCGQRRVWGRIWRRRNRIRPQ